MAQFTLESAVFHGDTVRYVDVGAGAPVVLVHGLLGSHQSWSPVIDLLARKYRVIAPDLIGAGQSDKPRGDYSLSAHAATVRDLLDHLGIPSATLVGHSHGGGVAMQMLYLFRERVDALGLVASGGLGREVSPLLRAAALPGSELVLPLLAAPALRGLVERVGDALGPLKGALRISASTREVWRTFGAVARRDARDAFLATTRAVLGPFGQNITAVGHFPGYHDLRALVVWGRRDRMIPVAHAERHLGLLPRAELAVFENAGHFPHLDEPRAFTDRLDQFLTQCHAEARTRAVAGGGAA